MSHLEKIVGELRSMVDGVERAMTRADAAQGTAHEVEQRAAASGFTGIAAGMSPVGAAISEIQAALTSHRSSLISAALHVTTASRMTTPQQASASLSLASEQASAACDGTSALIDRVEQVQQRVAAVLLGGQPERMLSALDGIKQELTVLTQRGEIARQDLASVLVEARRSGDPEGSSNLAAAEARSESTVSERGLLTESVRAAAAMLPRRTDPHDKTEAALLVGDAIVHDRQFAAEPDGRLRSRQIAAGPLPAAGVGLRPPVAQATVMDHAEAQAAAILRRPGSPTEATLVINNVPCDDPVKPLVCEKILAKILPPGTRLTVFLTDGNRTWLHKLYIGTGEGIRR